MIMTRLIFRKAEAGDLDRLCRLENTCFPTEPWSRQMFEAELENRLAMFVVAEEVSVTGGKGENAEQEVSKRLLGYIIAWVIAPAECQVGSIAVIPELRRKGLASQMLGLLEAVCRKADTYDIYLEVRVSNAPAIDLYRKFGFEIDGIRKRYYQDGEDAYTMACHLEPVS